MANYLAFLSGPFGMASAIFLIVMLCLGLAIWSIHISTQMPGNSSEALPREKLTASEKLIASRLRKHVHQLAEVIGPRNIKSYENLSLAALYIQRELESLGFSVRLQEYSPGGYARPVVNIEAERRGSLKPDEILVIGAHYDSVGPQCPGADDNASGCAALLWLAEEFRDMTPSRTIRFVAFANEEPPFFKTKDMGSYCYAKEAKEKKENIIAFICLESLGFYSEYPKTQHYPFPLSWWYPDTGNFIGFVGNWKSAELLRRSIHTFRATSKVPSVGLAAPSWFPGVSWSDHWSFWKHGFLAFMLTDTAPFRNQYYHTENDKWDTLDYANFARIMPGITAIIKELVRVKV